MNTIRKFAYILCAALLSIAATTAYAQTAATGAKINIHKAGGGGVDTYSVDTVSSVSFSDNAAGASNLAVVAQLARGGGRMIIALGDSPQLRLGGDSVTISSSKASATLSVEEIARISLQDATAGISSTSTSAPSVKSNGGTIAVEHFPAGTSIIVYGTAGETLAKARTDTQGNARISAASLPKGIYIVKAGNVTLKFEKK